MSRDRIEFTDLARLHAPLRADLLAATARVIDAGAFVLGAEVEAFEGDFARTVDARHAIGCGSGTDALVLALLAAGIGRGDRVIVPAFSFFATASAVARVGATPVFADVDPIDLHLSADSAAAASAAVARAAGAAPRAIVPVDLYGRPCRLEPIEAIARDCGAVVIEDAAQAIGAVDHAGRRAGSRGDFGCFSLYPTKNLGALGDAGMIVTAHAEHAERLRSLRSHGLSSNGRSHTEVGLNSRLDALQAALLNAKLPWLDKWTEARRSHATGYLDRFEAALGDATRERLQLPRRDTQNERWVAHQFVIRVATEHRDPLRAHLDAHGIGSAIYYDTPLHQQPALAAIAETPTPLPNAEAAAATGLALPVHPDLRPTDLDRVVDAVTDYLARA